MKLKTCIVILALLAFAAPALAAPITFFEMQSNGSYVVPKGNYYYDLTNSSITGRNSYSSNSTYYQNSPTFNINYPTGYWTLNFSTHELGGPMTVGLYDDATRFPFEKNGVPGLNLYGNGRGNNTLTGSFEVFDILYAGNTLLRFAATFEQNDLIFGRISYNSEAFSTAPVPEPATILLLGSGLGGLVWFRRRAQQSRVPLKRTSK